MKTIFTTILIIVLATIGLVSYELQIKYKLYQYQWWLLEIPVVVFLIYPIVMYWEKFIKRTFKNQ